MRKFPFCLRNCFPHSVGNVKYVGGNDHRRDFRGTRRGQRRDCGCKYLRPSADVTHGCRADDGGRLFRNRFHLLVERENRFGTCDHHSSHAFVTLISVTVGGFILAFPEETARMLGSSEHLLPLVVDYLVWFPRLCCSSCGLPLPCLPCGWMVLRNLPCGAVS